MNREQKFDRQVIKTLNFVKSLKLNFLSIERIVKAKTDLSLEQKTEVMNLIHKQYNINFKSNLALNPAIKNNNLTKDKFLKKSTIKNTDKIIKTAKKTINGTKTKPIRITTISKNIRFKTKK